MTLHQWHVIRSGYSKTFYHGWEARVYKTKQNKWLGWLTNPVGKEYERQIEVTRIAARAWCETRLEELTDGTDTAHSK